MSNDVYFDSGLEGWIRSYARSNYWRVSRWYDYEDLVQDGLCCYLKCRNKYAEQDPDPETLAKYKQKFPDADHFSLNTTNPTEKQRKHFMYIVQRAFFNHIMTLSSDFAENAVEETESCLMIKENGMPTTLEDVMSDQQEELSALMALVNAPTEIATAIKQIIDEGDEFVRTRLRLKPNGRLVRKRGRMRETSAERIARITGDPLMQEKIASYLLPVRRLRSSNTV